MGSLLSLIWEKLGEDYEWLKQQLVTFFRYLSKKTDEALNNARRFFDNFSEQFKEAIVKSKFMIDETMKKIVEVMNSMKSMFCRSFQAVKNKISRLIKSLIAWFEKLWDSIESFSALMEEVASKTLLRCKNFRLEDIYEYYCPVTGFVQLLKIIRRRPKRLPFVVLLAYLVYVKEPIKTISFFFISKLIKTISGMKFGSCFKNLEEEEYVKKLNKTILEMMFGSCSKSLEEDEKNAALFIYVVLNAMPYVGK